jgi:CO/xanthine dehydrogenase FAD-binding subunit
MGHTRVRRGITVGGSIGPLIGGFDLPVALLALQTRVTIAGPQGRRVAALPELYAQRLARAEMVVSIEVEPLPAQSGSSFLKYMARNVLEIQPSTPPRSRR